MQENIFEYQLFDQLKYNLQDVSNEASKSELKHVSQQLEATFVQMMLKSMREALPKGGLFSSEQTHLLTNMYDQQLAQDLSQKGLGFADQIYQQLVREHKDNISDIEFTNHPSKNINQVNQLSSQTRAETIQPFTSLDENMPVSLQKMRDLALSSQHFVHQLMQPVKAVSQKSGIPYLLILAQAALESGWGKKQILTEEGKKSHNLFGVKAGKGWKGPVTNILTTEIIDGKNIKMRDYFRVYSSYEESIGDYINLLTKNSRYLNVKQTKSPEMAAKLLHRAGYATDTNYSEKLISIINQIRHYLINKYEVNSRPIYPVDLKDLF
nr:flagellar assembly peptidoglycan hydrolase FlgJ [Providencia sneebia]